MPVHKDESGRRWVQAEVDVPGTPEEVWAAIATGPGISAWFVPTDLDGREGGVTVSHFGPGNSMDGVATITAWDPPRRFTADSRDNMGPGDPTIATEWSVQAKSGSTCTVRVVHSWFTDKDDWDNQFEGHSYGWITFFRLLRIYLSHFPGQPSSAFQLMGFSAASVPETWEKVSGLLGLTGAAAGEHRSTGGDAPPLAGTVEHVGLPEYPEILLRLDQPGNGIAHLVAHNMDGQIFLSLRVFLYGDEAAATVEQVGPAWQAWMAGHFPMPQWGGETPA